MVDDFFFSKLCMHLALIVCILLLDLINMMAFSVVLDRDYSEFRKELYCVLAHDSEEDLILFEEFRSGLL